MQSQPTIVGNWTSNGAGTETRFPRAYQHANPSNKFENGKRCWKQGFPEHISMQIHPTNSVENGKRCSRASSGRSPLELLPAGFWLLCHLQLPGEHGDLGKRRTGLVCHSYSLHAQRDWFPVMCFVPMHMHTRQSERRVLKHAPALSFAGCRTHLRLQICLPFCIS